MSGSEQGAIGEFLVVIRDDDGSAYAVPRAAMERFRMTPERRALVAGHLRAQGADVGGGVPLYEVDPADLVPYRLSKDEWTRLDAMLHDADGDSQGFISGAHLPAWVAVAPRLLAAERPHVHTLPAWYWLRSVAEGRNGPSQAAT